MTDQDLKKIIGVPTPKPRGRAREAARTAALSEFDAFQDVSKRDAQTNRRDFNLRSKGFERRARLSSNQTLFGRKTSMRSLTKYAVAASVVAVALVGPAALYLKRYDGEMRDTGHLSGGELLDLKADREERPASPSEKIAAEKLPALPRPAPIKSKTKAPRVVKTAKVKPDNRPVTAYLGGGRQGNAKPRPSRLQVRPHPRDRVMGGVANNQAIGPASPSHGIAGRNSRSHDLLSFGASATCCDNDDQRVSHSRDKFQGAASNPIKQVATDPVSTFSLDVDTASYAFVRRALNAGRLPPKEAVRVEELVNYFNYAYAPPESADDPFKVQVNVVPSPWSDVSKLVHLSVKGYQLSNEERPPANLVFLIDVSGSMTSQDKLPLVKNALRMLVNELKPDDTIGIVTYASGTAVALEPTKVKEKHKVLSVIGGLRSGGSTAGARGIQDAYRLAQANFDPEGVNRIILATDGDFNVGITNRDELKSYIERKRNSGVFLSILGVGQGNYNDALMQTLAQNGNGTASYIDTMNEARKVLVDEASATLFTIAKDVKVQVEFNPERVQSYRLIGYETRALKREDFNNDRVDAGDVGSGHSVTAIYEITPVGAPGAVDDLRYGTAKTAHRWQANPDSEFGFVKLRYKLPNETASKLITQAITPREEKSRLDMAPEDARFSIAVAGFGQLLRDNPALHNFSYDDVIGLAQGAKGEDRFGYRAEFINLVRNAKSATR